MEEKTVVEGGKEEMEETEEAEEGKEEMEETEEAEEGKEEMEEIEEAEEGKEEMEEAEGAEDNEDIAEPEIVHADWSEYFNGLNGTAVIYDASNRRYVIYNDALAVTRRSPCSTFKIVSSLTALEHGILEPEASTRTWSGEVF